jgi:hypothetical protein
MRKRQEKMTQKVLYWAISAKARIMPVYLMLMSIVVLGLEKQVALCLVIMFIKLVN